ncbi:predicted protein [Thalassiosira pseudonana CCMP1335]|uniref:Syndetin C-terminal domain-containing protein n=1 Tax=Thalassiosira pseudonana TaxID=35128 RepID=B8BZL7_THAPS|nr:predicted protein [Thalassiosira pseudonana CCMP1335]EED93374.1 predicted protein [Thalassiosira pseudonana CCMP1335]
MSTRTPQDKRTPLRGATPRALLSRLCNASFGAGAEKTNDDTNVASVRQDAVDDEWSTNIDDVEAAFGNNLDRILENQDFTSRMSEGDDTSDYDGEGIYDICTTIDESMQGLHTCLQTNERVKIRQSTTIMPYEYDWMLDGYECQSDDGLSPASKSRRRQFGDAALDQPLGMMELEDPSFATTPGSSKDSILDENEGVVTFADFSQLELDDHPGAAVASANNGEGDNDWSGFVSAEILVPKHSKQATDGIPQYSTGEDNSESAGFRPPSSIEQLTNHLDTELSMTIEQCLAQSPSLSTSTSGEDNDSDDMQSPSRSCTNMTSKLAVELSQVVGDSDLELETQQTDTHHQQSLLMSSTLLESLPMPLPDTSTDNVASFTFRIQQAHLSAKARGKSERHINTQQEDEQLEEKLIDTIHSSYYHSDGYDIVLDEMLNVPWPFHVAHLDEPWLETDVDTDDSDNFNDLNFDSYISNRLSQLDYAHGEVMNLLLSRVSQKEEAIDAGTEQILAAELDVATAVMYANASRECLHRAMEGYPVMDEYSLQTINYDAVSGGFAVVQYSDSRDKLRYLLETIDRISGIRNQELQFWNKIQNLIPPTHYETLINDARRLKELNCGEEVLLMPCLESMRVRIDSLPDVLRGSVEESLAELFRCILKADANLQVDFEQYASLYETLIGAWVACFQLRENDAVNIARLSNSIAAEWSGCVLKVLCFEIAKAYACSFIDSSDGDGEAGGIDKAKNEVENVKFNSKDESEMEALSQKLQAIQLGVDPNRSILSSSFFHLASRLVEAMSLYSLLLQWHESLLTKATELASAQGITDISYGNLQDEVGDTSSQNATMSTISSDQQSSSECDGDSSDEPSVGCVPESLEFKKSPSSSLQLFNKIMQKNMQSNVGSIRHLLYTYCESTLVKLFEAYSSGPSSSLRSGESSMDLALRNLSAIDTVKNQFISFAKYFLGSVEDDDAGICIPLDNELSKLYRGHLRTVHIEAMKTTGTLLRHETWQLTSVDLPQRTINLDNDEKKCMCSHTDQGCGDCSGQNTTMTAIYEAVCNHLSEFIQNNSASSDKLLITTRAVRNGYKLCDWFKEYLDTTTASDHATTPYIFPQQLRECVGLASKEFAACVLEFAERKSCGELCLSLLTQSCMNGLVKWTGRLIAVGNALPSVANDVSYAITTLFDLYILTVFRMCARNSRNEDVLVGLRRGSSSFDGSNGVKSNSVSLTIEADICAPLPREVRVFEPVQHFVTTGRSRLENIVNLDRFESANDMGVLSPRSLNELKNASRRLEKDTGAAASCLFAAILIDVASKAFQKSIGSANEESFDSEEESCRIDSLETYALDAISMAPLLTQQSCRLACVHSISGKELIFQIICVGKAWEDRDIMEHSNAYVDDLLERCGEIWGHLSSSSLPQSVLKYVWNQLVRSAFLTLQEGFSKISNCSTEGRSLMSMDLATLSHGLISDTIKANLEEAYPTISPPPDSCREEVMRYVDAFIKVFYYPDEDTLDWIRENAGNYHFEHSLSLVTVKCASGCEGSSFWAARKDVVREIYRELKL